MNLPRLSVYSFRHKGTTVLRKAKVPDEQIAYQLGHRRPKNRSTRAYGEYDPSYLAEAAAALDAWIARVLHLAAGNSHGIPAGAKASRKKRPKPLNRLVGATGIEPVTPTMSR